MVFMFNFTSINYHVLPYRTQMYIVRKISIAHKTIKKNNAHRNLKFDEMVRYFRLTTYPIKQQIIKINKKKLYRNYKLNEKATLGPQENLLGTY